MANTGVLIISWGTASDAQIKKIVSELYRVNAGPIKGMDYREYGPESSDRIKKCFSFIENEEKPEEKSKKTQTTLF